MCGIIGYLGPQEAMPIILDGLKRLEYRGYDSSGIATLVNGKIERRRAEGKLINLAEKLKKEPLGGTLGIIQGLAVESISQSTSGTRVRIRVTQLTDGGQRITLSGLIVDKYEDVLVVQCSALGMDRRKHASDRRAVEFEFDRLRHTPGPCRSCVRRGRRTRRGSA